MIKIIYYKDGCIYSKEAYEYLKNNDILISEISIDRNKKDNIDEKKHYMNKYNYYTLPMILYDDKLIGGYEELMDINDTIKKIKLKNVNKKYYSKNIIPLISKYTNFNYNECLKLSLLLL